MNLKRCNEDVISITGLGYVGLPLAIEFGSKFNVIAFDKNLERISQLKNKIDKTEQINKKSFYSSKKIKFTNDIKDLKKANIHIICVPTPVTKKNKPDFKLIKSATNSISKIIKRKDIIIFESTFYPGMTEEICIPILEKRSKLKLNKDFFCGYSPERINPSDQEHTLTDIVKVVSATDKNSLKKIKSIYEKIIKAGVYTAPSIKSAEAAKVIENIQRDINIAFMNELSKIFKLMNLDTKEVLQIAGTKWNFLNFSPGLVGGHCIGVDPYYLTYKSSQLGYEAKFILSGREINNSVIKNIQFDIKKIFDSKGIYKRKKNILILGASFKENCPDFRNSKAVELGKKYLKQGNKVDFYDPLIDSEDFFREEKIKLIKKPKNSYYDLILLTVPHKIFSKIGVKKLKTYGKINHIFYDVKSIFNKEDSDGRL